MKNLDSQDKNVTLSDIVLAGRALHASIDAVDEAISRSLGVHRSDLRCLHHLESGALTAREIGLRTGLTSGSVTALIDRLERAGFVERDRSLSDRRSVAVRLTGHRHTELGELYGDVAQELQLAFTDFDDNKLAESVAVLRRCSTAFRAATERITSSGTD